MVWSLFSRRARGRASAFIIITTLLGSPVAAFAQPAPAPAPATDAKASLADADKAAKAKDWATAARSYDAANKATPSTEALDGLANAQYQAGQLGEAHASYTEWLAKYGDKAPAAKKTTAQARVKELGEKTGTLAVTVNEAGATVLVDDKQVGTTPLPAPLRLTAGPHRVRVTKDGFTPFDQAPNVSAGGTGTVQVDLVASTAKAKLVVKEKTGKPIRVTIDGVDVGDAPWTGDVEPGQHDVGARGTGLVAAPEKVTVERGKTKEIELVASSSSSSVKIATSDGKGLIYLDGKLVGEGSFIGDIPSGPHKLKITREGYDPFEEDIVVKDKEPYGRTIVLKISGKIETGPVQVTERLEGIYGGFTLQPVFTPGGTGSQIEKDCANKDSLRELAACNVGGGIGGGIGGFVGYHWDPVGIELFFAGQYDQMKLQNDWNAASTDPGIGPDPARIENFSLRRAGGMGLARVRVTKQWTKIRLSFAGGAGLSYRVMFLERETLAKDNSGATDRYVSDKGASYLSMAVQLEPSVMYRLTPGVAVSLGLSLVLDSPTGAGGENPRTESQANHVLVAPNAPPRGLSTPSYELASNMQIFLGPTLGMMFGP